jgi:hypothetical protein
MTRRAPEEPSIGIIERRGEVSIAVLKQGAASVEIPGIPYTARLSVLVLREKVFDPPDSGAADVDVPRGLVFSFLAVPRSVGMPRASR